ncbi:PH domain-containing protein [Streptomyces sp. NBC_01198]|uniref:PH domain-containing protein n=1 Tax=Streptomyces sp. NBC_01198 TaxID=2903769 RepID=UPI002E0F30F3|nr:PH domain-containing protein [Streptomyces sp. NBC_01198]
MTSPRSDSPTPPGSSGPGQPKYADRAYRSMAGMVGGVGLVLVACWLGGDAIAKGKGHTPWLALAALLLALPVIVALTLRPAVFANSERIRVRNPFRTITVPWAGVDAVRSSYSTELLAGGKKYQLWAIPVSLRARKRAARQDAKMKAAGDSDFTPGAGRRPTYRRTTPIPGADPTIRAWSDQALSELRELAERHEALTPPGATPTADGESTAPVVRWCWEVLAPAAAGAVVLIVLLAIG